MIFKLRRPVLAILGLTLIFTIIYTKHFKDNLSLHNDEHIKLEGVVLDLSFKQNHIQYIVADFLIKDFNKTNVDIGDKVQVYGKFKSLDNYNLNDFDYGLYLRAKGYNGVIIAKDITKKGKNNIYYHIHKTKTTISEKIDLLYNENSPIVKALILGDKSYIQKSIINSFTITGTSHVMALSGLHVGIIASTIHFLTRWVNKYLRFVILLITLIFYCFIVGLTPSIIRATLFIIIFYIATFIEREYDTICAISFVAILLIINNPFIIYNISFQLSFLAVLSISCFYHKVNRYFKYPLISVTICATIMTWPIIYYNYKIFSVISLLANLLVVWAVGVIINLALLSLFFSILSTNLAFLISNANTLFIKYIVTVVKYLSEIEYSHINFENTSLSFMVLYYIIVVSYLILSEIYTVKEQKNAVQGYNKRHEKRSIS
ncbi:competence protein ComEC [Alkalithermobacter thermoalcaliphilus JW-YL-7 = DSM 7308]|uniref:ComEC/Rec2-related protein n=1 Tax=Alkalithermobacter thermoalcaliphilus JW-YL-7 = DSM 7308 TaxID=1121328 RepID=A0A150FR78_CLOPD|nr:ComEC/Rec2-related protein [[Clostridium] paradoxum JW-YL-7 = DSM 7308]SHL01605.1 competence protein ComEC [[Clostridium] paradoxum JW-YL-7 = DSM 7308]